MAWSSWFWATTARVLNLATISPFRNGIQQVPLQSDLSTAGGGPIFRPPPTLGDDGTNFTCDYSRMKGWRACSTKADRSCWLENPTTEERFDINTDYEARAPVGVLRQYTVTVENGTFNADGRNFTEAKMFNGSYPGPWLRACWGDTMEVTVKNNMKYNGTSIHWHGIRQFETMHMDGVNGVTQCAIPPGGEFTYKWNVTQYGSSWYHSHYSVQYADGTVGPMTLHGPSSGAYDVAADWPLILTDWGNNSAFAAIYQKRLDSPSMVINGTGNITRFINGIATERIPKPYTLTFNPKQKYLLRIINTSFRTAFVFSIDNHNLTVIGSDFVPLHPYNTTHITVGIGQRFHIVVHADPIGVPYGRPLNFWIRVNVIKSCEDPRNIKDGESEKVGILRYAGSPLTDPLSTPWDGVYNHICVDESFQNPFFKPVVPWYPQPPVNGAQGETRLIGFKPQGTPRPWPLAVWSMENASMANPLWTPLRIDYGNPTFLHLNNTKEDWPSNWVVIPENYTSNDWVYLVINGGSHPIHLHGHDFAVVQQEYGDFSPDRFHPNIDNPPRRDVIIVPDGSSPDPQGGFAVIAFKTDNPGTWLMHCHIAFHASGGLALQIMERQADANLMWPWNSSKAICSARELCDNWNDWYSNCSNWWPGEGKSCPGNVTSWFQDDSGI